MKKVALVYCEEALFGRYSPISFLTEANLSKALGMAENKTCDLVYVALDHFDATEKEAAKIYLNEYRKVFPDDFQEKFIISASNYNYTAMFVKHIMYYANEIHLDILAKAGDKLIIANDINGVIDTIDVILDKLNAELEKTLGKRYSMPRIWISK
jgi:hypothetical protein